MKITDNLVPDKESLEARIGLYWLHKLGIVSIVLGVAFLIMYSFQYFAPALKLLTGCGVSASLILLGTGLVGVGARLRRRLRKQ